MNRPPAPRLVPLGEYQAARLRDSLEALAEFDWHPDLVEHTRIMWGATEGEVRAVLAELRGDHRGAA